MEEDEFSFLGRGWSFPPTFDKSIGGVTLVSDEEDIKQGLAILLSTQVGERLFEPRFGCNLQRFQFEQLDTTIRTYIKELVNNAILYFEPRITLETVNLTTQPNLGRLDIDVSYFIPSTNNRDNLVFPFYLDEPTDGVQ